MIPKWFRAYGLILRTQLFHMRTGWIWYLFLMALQPLTMMLFLRFVFPSAMPSTMFYIVSGNIVMALSISSMLAIGQELGWMKADKALDYYATLPVPKSALIFAIVTRSTLFSFIPIAFIIILAVFLFDIRLSLNPMLLLVLCLSGYSMAGLGAVIGFYSPNARISSLLTQIVQPLVIFLSPVFVPIEQLPQILQWASNLVPTTYVANALRAILANQVDMSTWVSIGVVFGITVITLFFVERGLDWRGEYS